MISEKGAKTIQWEKDSIFKMDTWKTRCAHSKKTKMDFYTIYKSNLKWIKDLNITAKQRGKYS